MVAYGELGDSDGYYFGVSATTADLSDNHDVVSLKLIELSKFGSFKFLFFLRGRGE